MVISQLLVQLNGMQVLIMTRVIQLLEQIRLVLILIVLAIVSVAAAIQQHA